MPRRPRSSRLVAAAVFAAAAALAALVAAALSATSEGGDAAIFFAFVVALGIPPAALWGYAAGMPRDPQRNVWPFVARGAVVTLLSGLTGGMGIFLVIWIRAWAETGRSASVGMEEILLLPAYGLVASLLALPFGVGAGLVLWYRAKRAEAASAAATP